MIKKISRDQKEKKVDQFFVRHQKNWSREIKKK